MLELKTGWIRATTIKQDQVSRGSSHPRMVTSEVVMEIYAGSMVRIEMER